MSNSRQYSLNDCHFPADLALGFVRIANAHQLPLSEALMRADPDEAVMRLDWKDSKSGEWAMVVISMFRFPGGEKEFERVCKWFGERKQRIRLPEGIAFAPEHNAFPNIPPSWSHEAWAESKYEVRHTYRRDNSAMFVRWSGTRAAMITHPLFVMVRENVQVVDGQWETTLPETTRNEGSEPEFIARSIDDALRREITVSAGRARTA